MPEDARAPTIWWCLDCHASGLDRLGEMAVYDALYALEAAHNRHVLARAQACVFSVSRVRVKELTTRDEAQDVST
jgi:hypothetical protein